MAITTNGVTPGNGNDSVYTVKPESPVKELDELQRKIVKFFNPNTEKNAVKNSNLRLLPQLPMMDYMRLDPKMTDIEKFGNTFSKCLQEHPGAINDAKKVISGEMSLMDFNTKYSIK